MPRRRQELQRALITVLSGPVNKRQDVNVILKSAVAHAERLQESLLALNHVPNNWKEREELLHSVEVTWARAAAAPVSVPLCT